MTHQWRKVNFFDSITLNISPDLIQSIQSFQPTLSCTAPHTNNHNTIGIVYGNHKSICILYKAGLDREYELANVNTDLLPGDITQICINTDYTQLYVLCNTINDKQQQYYIAVYSIDIDKTQFKYNKTVSVFNKANTYSSINCMSIDHNQQCIYIGCDDGKLLYISELHNILYDGYKPIVKILTSESYAVLQLYAANNHIFLLTQSTIVSLYNAKQLQRTVINDEFADVAKQPPIVATSYINDAGEHILCVCESNGIFYYSSTEKLNAIFIDYFKYRIQCYKSYVVLVLKHDTQYMLNVYDIKHKLLIYTRSVESIDQFELYIMHNYILIQSNNTYYCISEKSAQQIIDNLLNKHLYDIASKQTTNKILLNKIHYWYAIYLYDKKHYDSSIEQFCSVLDTIDTSLVVNKFIDQPQQLIVFLLRLHTHSSLVNKYHTSLLFNLYIKTNQSNLIDTFLNDTQYYYNADDTIDILKQLSMYDDALKVARKHNKLEQIVDLCIQSNEFNEIIDLLNHINDEQSTNVLMRYGEQLIQYDMDFITDKCIRICLNNKITSDPNQFIALFNHQSYDQQCIKFCESVQICINTDHVVYTKLIELYLKYNMKHNDILTILQRVPIQYDRNVVLNVCVRYSYTAGILYLYKKLQQYELLFDYYVSHNEYDRIIDLCIECSDIQPNIWLHALNVFVKNYNKIELLGDQNNTIPQLLQYINKNDNVAPTHVIQLLTQNSSLVQLQCVVDYLQQTKSKYDDQVSIDQIELAEYESGINEANKKIQQLQSSYTEFQHNQLCDNCNKTITLPYKLFLCQHIYHQRCLSSDVCDKCSAEYNRLIDMKQQIQDTSMNYDNFIKQLDNNNTSQNSILTLTEYFGRGILQ